MNSGKVMKTIVDKQWHHLPDGEVLELLETSPEQGLDTFEVEHRQEQFRLEQKPLKRQALKP